MALQALLTTATRCSSPPGPPAVDCVDLPGRWYARALSVRRDQRGWQPDIADLESKITPRTKGLGGDQPNNPTGAVYGRDVLQQMLDLARKHQLLLLADEITTRSL